MDDISLLYESILITEMDDKVVNYLNQHLDKLPFDHIFGDKLRIVIPIGGDLTAQEIVNDIKRIKDYAGMDLKKGEVTRKIKLDPKYGQGDEKEQKIGIGKVIAALKISEEKKKKYLNWLALYKDNLESALDSPEYAIVLSRAPIDVVRMSDHRNISSCHSQGGIFFQCAVQEAISGGAVAYAIRQEDLYSLDSEEELQDEEFFPDPDRGIRGVRGIRPPLARLRLRRLESENGNEVAIPDIKIYTDNPSIPGFQQTLAKYLQSVQPMTAEEFEDEKWVKRGGTYYDDGWPIDTLIDAYFDKDINVRVKHDYDDRNAENRHKSMGLEEDLQAIKNQYQARLTYCDVDYYLDDSDDVLYATMTGGCSFDISKFGLPDDAELSLDDEYEVRKCIRGEYDDDYIWSTVVDYLKDNFRGDRISRVEIDNKKIELSFYDDENMVISADRFDTFCYYVKDFDDEVKNMLEEDDGLLEKFTEAGLIQAPMDKNFSRLEAYRNDDFEFDTFSIESYMGQSKHMKLLFPEGMATLSPKGASDQPQLNIVANPSQKLEEAIWNLAKENFHPKVEGSGQMEFQKFFESYTNNMDNISFRVDKLQFSYHYFKGYNADNSIISSQFYIKPSSWDDKMFEFLDFLDDMGPHIKNLIVLIALQNFEKGDEDYNNYAPYNIQNLERVYSKYLTI